MKPPVYPLPFLYESTGTETRFTNGYDPEARSRRVFTFHRPETLAEWSRQITDNPGVPTFRALLLAAPALNEAGLWGKQAKLEFDRFTIADTQRKFPVEYNGQHLTTNVLHPASRVCISTIQRVFSMLKGDAELDLPASS
jgi:type I site-specific restriction endonuclease